MRKLFCLLMICLLPLSGIAAQAISTQMMLNQFDHQNQPNRDAFSKKDTMTPCHQNTENADTKNRICADCVACALAATHATISLFNPFNHNKKVADKFSITQSNFISIQLPPSIKPPIFQ